MGKAFKTWYFYPILTLMLLTGYYILSFAAQLQGTFPDTSEWDLVTWVVATFLAIIGLLLSVLITLSYNQSKENGKQQKLDHAENKAFYTYIKNSMQNVIDKVNSQSDKVIEYGEKVNMNFEQDLKLRSDHETLKKLVESHDQLFKNVHTAIDNHEERLKKLENR